MRNRLTFTLLMIFFTSLFIILFVVSDHVIATNNNLGKEKNITCIVVKEGDTLWKLAKEFYTDDYDDLAIMISEIKKCNGISDTIYKGQKLLIPYYSSGKTN